MQNTKGSFSWAWDYAQLSETRIYKLTWGINVSTQNSPQCICRSQLVPCGFCLLRDISHYIFPSSPPFVVFNLLPVWKQLQCRIPSHLEKITLKTTHLYDSIKYLIFLTQFRLYSCVHCCQNMLHLNNNPVEKYAGSITQDIWSASVGSPTLALVSSSAARA